MANKRLISHFAHIPVRSCHVTIQDMAATLYEAVTQGLAAIRGKRVGNRIAPGLKVVKVSVADVRVDHEVKLMDFYEVARTVG
jgi:hypothetical protein